MLYSLIVCFSPELLYSDELYFLLEGKQKKDKGNKQGQGNPNYTYCKVDLVNHVVLYFLLPFFFSFLHVDLEFRNQVLLIVALKGKGGKNRKKEKKETEKERGKNGHSEQPAPTSAP